MAYIRILNGAVEILETLPQESTATLLAILKRIWERASVFSSDGLKYKVGISDPVPKKSLFWRVAAETIYNPTQQVHLVYEQLGPYQLQELKDGILECVMDDDDILTQFQEAEDIQVRLNKASTFGEIVDVLNWLHEDTSFKAT